MTGERPWLHQSSKKGAKSNKPENISLTCILRKSLEHIIVLSVMKHLDNHDLLYPLQHGFRSKFSCKMQLLLFTQQTLDYMVNGKQTNVVDGFFESVR